MDFFSFLKLINSPPPAPTFHSLPLIARLVQTFQDTLAISGSAILTNQNGLVALERVKEL